MQFCTLETLDQLHEPSGNGQTLTLPKDIITATEVVGIHSPAYYIVSLPCLPMEPEENFSNNVIRG